MGRSGAGPRLTGLLIGLTAGAAAVVACHLGGAVPLRLGPLAILPGHLAVCVLPLLIILLMRGRHTRRTLWGFALSAGVLSADFLAMIVQADRVLPPLRPGMVVRVMLPGFAAAVTAALVVAVLLRGAVPSRPSGHRGASRIAAAILLWLAIVGFRAHHAYMRARGVPNEDRSLVVAGYEIHHAATGSLLAYVVGLVIIARPWWSRAIPLAIVAGIAVGAVADQALYYALAEVSDASYAGTASVLGALVFGLLYSACLLVGRSSPADSGPATPATR